MPHAPPHCEAELQSREVIANSLTFRCLLGGEEGSVADVLLLHGFPFWKEMYVPLIRRLAQCGFRSAAFDQRGYSPGASPESQEQYHYDCLKDDVFAVADALGFTNFHLVGHDHGAALGWYAVASADGKRRILSFTALSIPHLDAFSNGLLGDQADLQQQMASQYFTIFTRPGAAQRFWCVLGWLFRFNGFKSAAGLQKALWWYNGVFDAGVFAMPPFMSARTLFCGGWWTMALMRCLFGGVPSDGIPQRKPIGPIEVPVLYGIGAWDMAILGTRPYAKKTEDFCVGGYRYVELRSGHSVMNESCITAVVAHIQEATS
mmetsp:Transcript_13324/g.35743  ORF Transcript_13324/g.35743 Transcript_13324/m.35743 type:complete len:318 (-) Transcript_13324:211-1164(-)|eukprot:CAMPEP_0117461842 /NCGR_PEP_ID=MMETSP0784-20121206/2739_1 /TAXON_ID=39447 /ORGANISM="" /LENGTH=317 /DNA_ID=CAMNT_0005255573 /DNA_START=28 /DNA_END=981 /DNA_ORIENTATION=+